MTPFLQVPPFPGARAEALQAIASNRQALSDFDVDGLIERVRERKVGGTYWAAQPVLPDSPFTLVRMAGPDLAASVEGPVVVWSDSGEIRGDCDPWHMVGRARRVIVDSDDPLALIAAIAGVEVHSVGDGRYATLASGKASTLRDCFRATALDGVAYVDPFSGSHIELAEAIELCGLWRDLVDSNRKITAAVGFAAWKQATVAPLLWGGGRGVPFVSKRRSFRPADNVAAWKSRVSAPVLDALGSSGASVVEVEDGFIRSAGLGADCVPPLSIIVDPVGVYFDPSRPSRLEQLLESADFPESLLGRARRLRKVIVDHGISKYSATAGQVQPRSGDRRHLLVPGQVEDDRSIVAGGGEVRTNLELLRRCRRNAPDAFITYKPHPDVEAGHRKGSISDQVALTVADEVVRDQPIAALIDAADEVHVNTSLAGFEALLREKPVTAYGAPFFCGWGLTCDLGPVPIRRTARRSLDELVAAVLLLYPRYLDPVTGLPCPPEVLLNRLRDGTTGKMTGTLVRLRRLQGMMKRAASRLRSWP